MASGAAHAPGTGEDDMTERTEDFDRDDERDKYGGKTNDNKGSSAAEQAERREREMEESGEENAA
jgi:hypothetical protein